MEGKTIVELKNICKSFPGVQALSNVSFDIKEGEVHALCGENGAGKSTLIKILTGAQPMDSGTIEIDGEVVNFRNTQDSMEKGIACIYQELSIVPQLDVAKNVFLGKMFKNRFGLLDFKKLYADTDDIMKNYMGLSLSPRTIAGTLSVGQQQMVEIARALSRHARVIIMDEPTSSLSEDESETLFKLIDFLRKDNVAIIYISHKLDEVMALSDRISILRDGQNVTTLDKNETNTDQLIAQMIGRSMENMYSKRPPAPGETILEVKNLSRENVFENISFSARSGEVLGFFGLVGAGRSEIMRAVFGADKYDSGTVTVAGEPLRSGSPTKAISAGIGFCTEDRKKEGLALRLSVLVNSTIVYLKKLSRFTFINRKEQLRVCDEYVKSISIKTPSVKQLAGNLSGGNQQKVVLAKWLMTHPKVLILDEPTRGIDVGSKAEIYSLIDELAHSGVAVVIVSSEIEEVMNVCDRVIVIAEGRFVADFPTEGTDFEKILSAAFGGEAS